MCANRCRNFSSQKYAQERNREDFKIQRPYNRNRAHVEYKSISDTSNNRDDWNHFKIILKIPEQHTGKARNEGTTVNSLTGHCSQTT